MWVMEGSDCDCSGGGAPPVFMLPPPPRPPFLQNYCTEDPLPDIEICDALLPMIDASYHSSPSLKAYSVIISASAILCFVIFISIILVWKHKRKVQNFLPCKSSPATNHCSVGGTSDNDVIYEDLNDVIPRPPPPIHHHLHIEMLDVKNGYASGYPPQFTTDCSHHPVYEELSDGESVPTPHSDDEFAEDELSLNEECPPPPYHHHSHHQHHHPPIARRPATTRHTEFHEGMLALLQMYPAPQRTSLPYFISATTFRPPPKPHSQDSALGSDSGYSITPNRLRN